GIARRRARAAGPRTTRARAGRRVGSRRDATAGLLLPPRARPPSRVELLSSTRDGPPSDRGEERAMAWSDYDRRRRRPRPSASEQERFRRVVLARANYRCEIRGPK